MFLNSSSFAVLDCWLGSASHLRPFEFTLSVQFLLETFNKNFETEGDITVSDSAECRKVNEQQEVHWILEL